MGTNNHSHTADEVYEGIMAIVSSIRGKQHQANVIVVVSINNLTCMYIPSRRGEWGRLGARGGLDTHSYSFYQKTR